MFSKTYCWNYSDILRTDDLTVHLEYIFFKKLYIFFKNLYILAVDFLIQNYVNLGFK